MGVADNFIEQGITTGRKIGRQEGILEGGKKGQEIGIKKAKEDAAPAVLKDRSSVTKVSTLLNLSRSRVQSIKNRLGVSVQENHK